MKTFNKYYPFWLGLIFCVYLIGLVSEVGFGWTFAVFTAYLIGYFNLSKLHD